ncbi:arylalkylamine N-acetyltransferase-like 2 isoform X1 [Drosophila nasuta]|uniref:arylalkylamine N-acetyltransferase-like 2 isoform X1 n=1 Tax=Drosophila nasuta TaxID=42062 RepID=UPI00295F1CE9|nr:arylalkylamine N-acetyltransferase-like 2 isoform X1 [Drosophila nasuta]
MSTNFGKEDGVFIRIMTMDDYEKIGENIYNEEPLKLAMDNYLKIEPNQSQKNELEEYHHSMVKQGTCLVAINDENGGDIVGSVLAGCETLSDLQEYYAQVAAMEEGYYKTCTIFEFETKIKGNYFDRYGVSKVLYSHMTNVDASHRGKGLGARLAAALMELGRSKGFPIMIACCTSLYTARQKEALGMECIYSQAYADYKDANAQVVFNPPAPHTHVRVMAIKL